MHLHRYPPYALAPVALALLALAGCETHIFTECPPGARCVVLCDEVGHNCRVEVEEMDADASVPPGGDHRPGGDAPAPDHRPPMGDAPAPQDDPPQPDDAPADDAPADDPDDACVALCEDLDKDSAACALSVLSAAHADCDRPPVCDDLLDAGGCLACVRALETDCAAVGALCLSP